MVASWVSTSGQSSVLDRQAPMIGSSAISTRSVGSPRGPGVPFNLIKALVPIGKDSKGALEWVHPTRPKVPRGSSWPTSASRRRHGKQLRDIAAHVLDDVDPAELVAAVARVKAAQGKRGRAPRRTSKADLVARYRGGEHIEVWQELRRSREIDGELREEALAVAVETMRRVARCRDLAAERPAAEHGWRSRAVALGIGAAPPGNSRPSSKWPDRRPPQTCWLSGKLVGAVDSSRLPASPGGADFGLDPRLDRAGPAGNPGGGAAGAMWPIKIARLISMRPRWPLAPDRCTGTSAR